MYAIRNRPQQLYAWFDELGIAYGSAYLEDATRFSSISDCIRAVAKWTRASKQKVPANYIGPDYEIVEIETKPRVIRVVA